MLFHLFNLLAAKDATFYDKLKTVKAADFYIYAWSILGSLNISMQTLDATNWKYKSSVSILNSPNYKELAEAFLAMNRDTSGWFKEHIFNYYIGDYMRKDAPVLTRTRQRKI